MLLPPTGSKKANIIAFEKFVQRHYLNTEPTVITNYYKSWGKRTVMLVKNEGGPVPR